mmetsp:Transcript_21163/g.48995  ORF Transcript_21163/g.48995 Transcript_21163/m.48995 type:complete len:256 (-) Transcript_21163:775-1542(-)
MQSSSVEHCPPTASSCTRLAAACCASISVPTASFPSLANAAAAASSCCDSASVLIPGTAVRTSPASRLSLALTSAMPNALPSSFSDSTIPPSHTSFPVFASGTHPPCAAARVGRALRSLAHELPGSKTHQLSSFTPGITLSLALKDPGAKGQVLSFTPLSPLASGFPAATAFFTPAHALSTTPGSFGSANLPLFFSILPVSRSASAAATAPAFAATRSACCSPAVLAPVGECAAKSPETTSSALASALWIPAAAT